MSRIRELAKQTQVDFLFSSKVLSVGPKMQEFAECIIRECAKITRDENAQNVILKHFQIGDKNE